MPITNLMWQDWGPRGRGIAALGLVLAALTWPGCASLREDPWRAAVREGELAALAESYEEAESHYRTAIELAGDRDLDCGTGQCLLSRSYTCQCLLSRRYITLLGMGGAAAKAGRYSQALSHLEAAIRWREERRGAEDQGLAFAFAELAPMLARARRLEEALEAQQRLDRLWCPHREIHDYFLADSYRRTGEAFLEMEQPQIAADLFERSLQERQFSVGSKRFDVALSWIGYADALRALGDADEASAAEERADEILDGSSYFERAIVRLSYWLVSVQRWADSDMPLKVYIASPLIDFGLDEELLRQAATEGVLAWSDVVRPGVPSFTFVGKRTPADIKISWGGGRQKVGMAFAHTRVRPERQLRRVPIKVTTRSANGAPLEPDLIRTLVKHETGHALGIWGHSPYKRDIMWWTTTDQSELSDRDRQTLREIYEHEPGATWESRPLK